uniref:Uncharacterized protein n=1 Tax=Anguilla anguilla TaxID=7936 RepID=A0A0E9RCA3_ANGAN
MGAEGGPEPHPPGPASEEQGEQLELSSMRKDRILHRSHSKSQCFL